MGVEHRIGQQHRKRLVADERLCAEDRVSEPVELLLVDVVDLGERVDGAQLLEKLGFSCRFEPCLQRGRRIEVVLNGVLAGAGDDQNLFDAGGCGLFDHILDHRFIHQRNHLLRHRPREGEKSRTEPGGGKDCFADFLFHSTSPSVTISGLMTLIRFRWSTSLRRRNIASSS